MEENLIGYLLDALDERARQQVENYLRRHPEAREELVRLRAALAPLAADQEPPAPPPALAQRTLARIAASPLPQAPPVSPAAAGFTSAFWRRADLIAAAGVLVVLTGLGLSVLGRLRAAALVADCQHNLHLFYTALQQYRDQHRRYPDVNQEAPRNVAGMIVPILAEAGTLPSNLSIRCPANGEPLSCPVSLAALRSMSDADFAQQAPSLSLCYAYSLGYWDEKGVYHGPGAPAGLGLDQLALMADAPPGQEGLGNSVNHGGAGQNVLFSDGHVVFLPKRRFGNEDDIFLNNEQKVAAGVGAYDIVLGASSAKP